MDKLLKLYHGSEKIIESPIYGGGKEHNDFGRGFYCTENIDLAKEWAVSSISNGFANIYLLDTEYLKVLNLNSSIYSILNWIAVLVENRVFQIKTPIARKARKYLIDNFSINTNAYDLIIGYRADDSYFDYAESFLNNSISINQLSKIMMLGKLGEQIVIKSEYAFSKLKFLGFEPARKEKYFILKKERYDEANKLYLKMMDEDDGGLFINDIMKGDIKNDDARIPRNISS